MKPATAVDLATFLLLILWISCPAGAVLSKTAKSNGLACYRCPRTQPWKRHRREASAFDARCDPPHYKLDQPNLGGGASEVARARTCGNDNEPSKACLSVFGYDTVQRRAQGPLPELKTPKPLDLDYTALDDNQYPTMEEQNDPEDYNKTITKWMAKQKQREYQEELSKVESKLMVDVQVQWVYKTCYLNDEPQGCRPEPGKLDEGEVVKCFCKYDFCNRFNDVNDAIRAFGWHR